MNASEERAKVVATGESATADSDCEVALGTLPLVRELFQQINNEGVRYCHWKSNLGLPASMRGETDLDLLVDSRDALRFREILGRNCCKPVNSDPSRHFPGLEDWLGLDLETGRLIHLHLHYRLVLGEQLVKNYALPLEQAFLDSVALRHGIKVPAPALELIVLALRALLKYRNRDVLRDLFDHGRSGIPPAILREIDFLRSRTSDAEIAAVLQQQVPFISPTIVVEFLRTIESKPRSGWALYRLRRRVRRELFPFQRHSRLRARATYYRRAFARKSPVRRVLLPFLPILHKRKTPAVGGLTVAIVGVDGAGKSTVVRELTEFFSWRLVTRKYYLGNTKDSLSRIGARFAGRVARHAKPKLIQNLALHLHELMLTLQDLSDARERYRQYCAGRRAAAGGAVVIFDRFPLKAIQIDGHDMDGARLATRFRHSTPTFAMRWLIEREQRYYDKILLPDLLVVLQITADIATARKTDHSPDKVAMKCQAVSAISREGLPLHEIDASRPLSEVLRDIKGAIWHLL